MHQSKLSNCVILIGVKSHYFDKPKHMRSLIIQNYIQDYINTISKRKDGIRSYIELDF